MAAFWFANKTRKRKMTWHDSRAVLSILPHLQTRRFLSVYAPLKLFTILWFISYESELMNFKEKKPSFWPLSIALLLNYSAFLQVQAMFFAFARQRGFYLRSLFCRLVSLPTHSLALFSTSNKLSVFGESPCRAHQKAPWADALPLYKSFNDEYAKMRI